MGWHMVCCGSEAQPCGTLQPVTVFVNTATTCVSHVGPSCQTSKLPDDERELGGVSRQPPVLPAHLSVGQRAARLDL